MENIFEKINELDSEIAKKLELIQNLETTIETIENEKEIKLQKLINDKNQFHETQINQECLSSRNLILRDKINSINETVKQKADIISDKNLMKLLGFKVSFTNDDENPNLLELNLKFTKENHNGFVKFLYDTVTDDYDLLEINPNPENFSNIKKFLRNTQDIQGFLSNYNDWFKA